jgi:hypothetical protein
MNFPSEIQAFIATAYAAADAGLQYVPQRVILPKRYTTTFLALAPGASFSQPLQIQANGDFVLLRIGFLANVGNGTLTENNVPVPQIRMQITDSGTDEQYCNLPVDINCFANNEGLAKEKVDEVFPRLVSGASTLNLTLSNYETGGATYNVDVVLTGVLVKTFGA